MPEGSTMSNIQLTARGYKVAGWAAAIGFILILGIAGSIEGM